MAKKTSASSRPEKLVSRKAEDIFDKPLTRTEKAQSARLKALPDADIDLSDIPALTDKQVAEFRRRTPKKLVTVRLDPEVLAWLQQFGEGYSTRINDILRAVMTGR